MANIWLPLRAGSDIILLGALIRYAIENEFIFREYLVHYTNAPVIISEKYQDTEDLEGLFSGWNPDENKYDPNSWLYEGAEPERWGTAASSHGGHGGEGHAPADLNHYEKDETLQHPRCVFQLLKRHFSRYTPEMVERFCGVDKEAFLHAAKTFCSASGPDKTGAICYAVGWTQHSTGVQIIRTAAILQLLLGNMGRPGGGVLALRGHASIQGSTDVPTLYDILPGYLSMPHFGEESLSLNTFVQKYGSKTGWWSNFDKYMVSLLKAYYGEAATVENEFGFHWLPRVTGDHSHQGYWLDMMDGKMDGLFVMGQNPAVAAPNSGLERRAMAKLKWMVVREMVETETASFWYESPEVKSGELKTEEIGTEVFLLPAAGHAEKAGTFTNTQRLLQWRNKAVEPPDDARSENWFYVSSGQAAERESEERYAFAERWVARADLGLSDRRGCSRTSPRRDIERDQWVENGHERACVRAFTELKADGSTTCGCWIYSGVFPKEGQNRSNERDSKDFYGHGWGWAWPADRRVLYNRASAKPDGTPWSERKKLVWWDAEQKKWTGNDVPDFVATKPPDYKPPEGAVGDDALAGDKPFILHPDGLGWIWAPTGVVDGPLPAHYEPLESPVRNAMYPAVQNNPLSDRKRREFNEYAASPDAEVSVYFDDVSIDGASHRRAGLSRTLSHLAELQPEMFAEISVELAEALSIMPGEWITVSTARGAIEAHALVTPRMQTLMIDGKPITSKLELPFHLLGYSGLVKGDIGNDLVAI